MCQTDFTESQLTAYGIVGNFDDDSNWQIRPRNVYIGKLLIFYLSISNTMHSYTLTCSVKY